MLVGTRRRSSCCTSLDVVDVAGCSVALSHHVKVPGVTLDSHLSFDNHISSICKLALCSIIFRPSDIFEHLYSPNQATRQTENRLYRPTQGKEVKKYLLDNCR